MKSTDEKLRARSYLLGCLLSCAAFVGCDQKALLQKFTPGAEDKLARQFLDDVIHSRIDDAMPMLVPQLQRAAGRTGLEELAGMFHGGQTQSIEVIGAFTSIGLNAGRTQRRVQLSYQLRLANGWFAGLIAIVDEGSGARISTARFNPIPDSLEVLNRFTLRGKGALHYLFLVCGVLVPAFCVMSLVICARSPIKRKWLWLLFILFGFVTFRLNWTTGETGYQILSFLLLGASIFKSGIYAPWILSIAVPIGAVAFMAKRKGLITQKAAEQSLPPPTNAPAANSDVQ